MRLFKKKHHAEDLVEKRFDDMMELVKDLTRPEYNRLKKAMDLGWQSYQTVRNVKTLDDIDKAEAILEKEEKNDAH